MFLFFDSLYRQKSTNFQKKICVSLFEPRYVQWKIEYSIGIFNWTDENKTLENKPFTILLSSYRELKSKVAAKYENKEAVQTKLSLI